MRAFACVYTSRLNLSEVAESRIKSATQTKKKISSLCFNVSCVYIYIYVCVCVAPFFTFSLFHSFSLFVATVAVFLSASLWMDASASSLMTYRSLYEYGFAFVYVRTREKKESTEPSYVEADLPFDVCPSPHPVLR